jgi:hypothetical protein
MVAAGPFSRPVFLVVRSQQPSQRFTRHVRSLFVFGKQVNAHAPQFGAFARPAHREILPHHFAIETINRRLRQCSGMTPEPAESPSL